MSEPTCPICGKPGTLFDWPRHQPCLQLHNARCEYGEDVELQRCYLCYELKPVDQFKGSNCTACVEERAEPSASAYFVSQAGRAGVLHHGPDCGCRHCDPESYDEFDEYRFSMRGKP